MKKNRAFTLVELPAVSKRKAIGFTLVELLVVVAIITLLASMVMPSLQRAFTLTRRVTCGSNLHQYGVAMRTYLKVNNLVFPSCHSGGAVVVNTTWIGALLPYADSKELAHCPELYRPQRDYGVAWEWKFTGMDLGYGYNMWFLGGSHLPQRNPEWAGMPIPMKRDTRLSSVKKPSMCLMFADSNPKIVGGQNYGCGISLFWPYVNCYHEGVNGSRHDSAAPLAFVDGHVETFLDPDSTINWPVGEPWLHLEYWDHLQRFDAWN